MTAFQLYINGYRFKKKWKFKVAESLYNIVSANGNKNKNT